MRGGGCASDCGVAGGVGVRTIQVIETGGTGTIVLGKIVYAHVRASAFKNREKLYVDPAQLRLIGRMHGAGGYCTTRDTFNIDRLSWPLEGKDSAQISEGFADLRCASKIIEILCFLERVSQVSIKYVLVRILGES